MVFTNAIGNYLIIAGIASFIILRFYKGKFPFIFLFIGLLLLGLRFWMKKIVVLKENNIQETLLTYSSNFEYKFQDGTISMVPVGGNTLINDSKDKLTVEKVEYSSYASFSGDDNIVATINPFSFSELENSISYYYEEPPKTIRVKGGGSTTRYWLHK